MKSCLIGNFADGMKEINGQTVKTFELYHALSEKISIDCIDTHYLRRRPYLFLKTFKNILRYNNYIICLSWSGYKMLLPIIIILKLCFRDKRIFDVVIGGIRHEQIKTNYIYRRLQKYIDVIYVESLNMQTSYKELGIYQVKYMPNFKYVKQYKRKDSNRYFRLCTMSRVCYEKGIEDAIEAVKRINNVGDNKIDLTIYGPLEKGYEEKFKSLIQNEDYIEYGGIINYHDTTRTLSQIDVLLFPTFWKGEGFPGTIIDAFASGTPVIASEWNCNSEIINNMKQGILIQPHSVDDLVKSIMYLYKNRLEVKRMSAECLKEYTKYTPKSVSRIICDDLMVNGG